MTYHIYRRPDGKPEISESELPLEIFPGYELLSAQEEKPDLDALKLEGNQLVPDIDRLRQARKTAIESVRDRKLVAPVIVYDGINLDADAISKSNLADVLSAVNCYIAKGQEMPVEKCVWKDYDNIIHTFPDTATYKDWLDGFVIAFATRNTDVWAWSWQKKAQLDTLTTAEDINAFNVTT